MSLWEKWERERLEKMGIKVEDENDVEIHDTHPKGNVSRQFIVVVGVLLACLFVVHFVLAINGMYSGRWANLYIVRVFAERAEQRAAQQTTNQ